MYKSEDFLAAWEIWKKHKSEKDHFPYTKTAEEMALSSLFKRTHGVESLAIEAITTSIEKNYSNIYLPSKNIYKNGASNQTGVNQTLLTGNVDEAAFGKL